jgi:hypothetical protein
MSVKLPNALLQEEVDYLFHLQLFSDGIRNNCLLWIGRE